jgi:hypothetical protein
MFSDSRSNFHTRVGYRTNVCRRRLASDLARASEVYPAQGALEDHHDRLPGSLHHKSKCLLQMKIIDPYRTITGNSFTYRNVYFATVLEYVLIGDCE